MFRFSELSQRAQIIAIGCFIKRWREENPECDITVESARELCILEDNIVPHALSGWEIESADGFYVREIPSTGEHAYYYFHDGELYALVNALGHKLG